MRKLVILTVILALVLGIAGVASAAVTQDQAGAKLQALGVIEGDEGGLRPNDNITRAEFAKIAVVLAGMEKSADVLKNTPSQFSDVKVGEWYTGWINLAASQGFVKGDPNGTYRPNDNITYAEVVTVLMRTLGYNDNLPGSWPVEYLAKAGELGITDDFTFDATAPAVRGNVFIAADATLDQNWVKYSKDTESFTEQADKLIEKNYKGSVVDDVLVTGWSYSNSEYTLDTAYNTPTSYKVADEFKMAGASDISGLKNKFVDLVLNDDDEVAVATVQDFTIVKDTEQDKSNSDYANATLWGSGAFVSGTNSGFKIKNDDKTYTLATNARVSGSIGAATVSGSTYTYTPEGASITLVFNKNNEVYFIKVLGASTYQPGLVEEVNTTTKRITTVDGASTNGLSSFNADASDEDTVYRIYKSGKQIDFADIKAGDTVSVSADTSEGLDYNVTIGGKQASGTLDSIEYSGGNAWRVKVDGTKYELATSDGSAARTKVSLNAGDSYKSNASMTADLEELLGKSVTLTLNGNGDVEYVAGNTTAAGGNYAIVRSVDLTYKGGVGFDILGGVNLLLGDGSKVSYTVTADSSVKSVGGTTYDGDDVDAVAEVAKGYTVKYSLTNDGEIDTLEVVDALTDADEVTGIDTDNKRVKVGTSWYSFTDSTVVFKSVTGTAKTSNWSEVKNYPTSGANNDVYYAKTSGTKLQYLVLADTVSTADTYAIVTEKGKDSDGYYLKLNVDGTVSRYDADDVDTQAGYIASAYKSLISFQASGSNLVSGSVNKITVSNATYTVDDVDTANKAVKITDGTISTWYYVDSDTVFYDVSGSPKSITLDDVFEGDQLNAPAGLAGIADANNVLYYLVIKND